MFWRKQRELQQQLLVTMQHLIAAMQQPPPPPPDPTGLAALSKAITEGEIARIQALNEEKRKHRAEVSEKRSAAANSRWSKKRPGAKDCRMCADPFCVDFTFEELSAHREHTGEKAPGAAPQQNGGKP